MLNVRRSNALAVMGHTTMLVSQAFALLGAITLTLSASTAHANPQSGTISAGQATITTSGKTLDITQSTDKAVIDWRSFNIAADELTAFHQPSSSSMTLNRVNDINPSQILGELTANGHVVLVNPNGVFFGPNSKIDVSGLVASTANISNDAFMAGGKLNFNQPGNPNASIIDQGTITAQQAGLVGFVAPNVENNGIIQAQLGKVTLASGDSFMLDMAGDKLISVAVSGDMQQQIVSNTGLIQADGGTVMLTAAAGRKLVEGVVSNGGVIQANSVGGQNGQIILYAEGSNAVPNNVTADKDQKQGSSTVLNNGTLSATGYGAGQTGGSISVLGDNVGILSGSIINASGDAGGGTIKIGGDFHGKGTTPTALHTIVDSSATIDASAITTGNGGNVTVWSDDYTNFAGVIQAKGGALSGNGGFVETSGKQILSMNGTVDASAPNGSAGTWLMDPADVTISGADSDVTGNPIFVPDGTQAEATINAADINTALNNGTSVSVTTGGDAASGTGGGSITVASNIAKTAGSDATLTLSAATDIIVNSNISISSTTGKLNTILDSDTAGNGGAIVMNTGSSITSNGGAITLGGNEATPSNIVAGTGYAMGDSSNPQGINLNNATVNAGAGNIIINGTAWSNAATGDLDGVRIKGGSVVETTSGAITLSGQGGTGNTLGVSGYGNTGVQVIDPNTLVTSAQGTITLTGIGGNDNMVSLYNTGVGVENSSHVTSTGTGSGASQIIINGTAAAGCSGCTGFIEEWGGGNDIITSVDGNITVTGVATGSNDTGVEQVGHILSTGNANITINATGGPGGTDYFASFRTEVGGASDTGNITFNINSIGFTSNNLFQTTGNVAFIPRTASTTIGVAGGSGTLQITSGAGSILNATTAGSITIGASADSGTINIGAGNFSTPTTVQGGSGQINVTADSFPTGLTLNTTGNVTIAPSTASTTLGVAGGAGSLAIGSTQLGDITAGSITIGNTADTGGMTVDANSWSYPLSLISGSGVVTIAGAQALGANNFTLETNATPVFSSTVTTTGSATVETSGGTTLGVGTHAAGTVKLNDTMIGDLSGGSYTFGSTGTGNMDINTALTYGVPVTFQTGSGGNITLDHTLVSSASGNAITLASGENFINDVGASALTPGSGRYLIYSANPSLNTLGGLSDAGDHVFNETYVGYAPGSVTQSGNLFLYSLAPTITVTANNASRLYGSADPTFTASYSGFVDNDTASILGGTPSLTTPGGDTATSAAGSTYAITAAVGSLAQSLGYQLSFAPGTLTVNKAPLLVTADSGKTMVYGASSLPTLTDTITGYVNGQNATSAGITGAATLSTTATAYNGTAHSGSNAGTYDINAAAGNLVAANYYFTYANAVGGLTVTPAVLTATADNQNRLYGAANPTFTETVTGYQNGDTSSILTGSATGSSTASATTGVGGYTITGSNGTLGVNDGNYTFATAANGTLTINQAPLTVTADSGKTMVYGASSLPTLTDTITGYVNGQNATSAGITGAATLSTTATAYNGTAHSGSNAGTYDINAAAGNLVAANYYFTYANAVGGLTVTPAVLTATADNQNRLYGAANPTFTETVTGYQNGDTSSIFTGSATGSSTASATTGVGGYTITGSNGTLGVNDGNYTFATAANGTLTINQAPLTVTADSGKTMVYGASSLPTLTDTITGYVNGQNATSAGITGAATLSTTATAYNGTAHSGSNAGTYDINAAAGNLVAANYYFTYANAVGGLTVTPAVLTATADNQNRLYGAANPTFTETVTGYQNGDTSSIFTGSATGSSTASATTGVGGYTITGSNGTLGVNDGNYTFATAANGTLTINPLPGTVSKGFSDPSLSFQDFQAQSSSYGPIDYAQLITIDPQLAAELNSPFYSDIEEQ